MASTGEFCGIDPDEMGRLAVSLDGAAARLTRFCHELEVRLQQEKVDVPALREITTIAEWGKSQCSMLLGRADLIRNLGDGAPELGGAVAMTGGQGLVHLPDDLESMERAQGLARMYGNDILVNYGGEVQATLIHEHADEIAQLADNPQAAAAFFALLPAKARDSLPNIIAATGSKTAKADLAAFGKALGAALNAPVLVPAFAKVGEDLTKPAGSKIVAWNRLALLKGANAPAKVRSAAARALVLDDFMKNPKQDWRAGSVEARTYGLPTDLVALGLEVLAGDGAAAREAFATMGGPDVKLSQVEKMKRFLDYADHAGTGDEVAAAFGRVVESGAEVATEKPGQHSQAAAVFAMDAMLATGPLGDSIPEPAREFMVTLATSYIHELASGARFDKAVDRASGLKMPENWAPLPGVTPAFYLSVGDTYRFMKTFTGVEGLTARFDATAAQFRYGALVEAAKLDKRDKTRNFEDTARMFGGLAGMEFKATLDTRGERDATDDLIREITKNTFSLGVDKIPVAGFLTDKFSEKLSEKAINFINESWGLTKTYYVSGLLDDWAGSFETRVEAATGARSDFILRQKYDMAYFLYEAEYPASDPPSELISKESGKLKTYDELLSEAKKEAGEGNKWEGALRKKLAPYEHWLDGNDLLDKKIEDASDFQIGERAKEDLRVWG
ncbi:hypothetical protein ABZ470_13620 [Streptosporangium sp. NPDC020072]|uniref:hypothetical protein n=1 Tax=Streptosporangium sp. NPDC020072 TaxID=3154788 RepID=UPI0034361C27